MTMRDDEKLARTLNRNADLVSETKALHERTLEVLARSEAAQQKTQQVFNRAEALVAANKNRNSQ